MIGADQLQGQTVMPCFTLRYVNNPDIFDSELAHAVVLFPVILNFLVGVRQLLSRTIWEKRTDFGSVPRPVETIIRRTA